MENFDNSWIDSDSFNEEDYLELTDTSPRKVIKPSKNNHNVTIGDYSVRGNTLFKKVTKKDGKEVEIEIGFATLVDSVNKNIETKEVSLLLKYFYDGWETATFERSKLVKTEVKTFLAIGIDMGGKKADDVLEFIDKHERLAPKNYIHSKLGWLNYDGGLIFRLNNAYKKAGEPFSKYNGSLSMEPKGSYKEWLEAVNSHIIGHTPMELILSASFASTIVGLLNVTEIAEVDTFLLNIVGNSTTGKTTAAVVAASPFGSPSITNNGLIQSFNATQNAMQSIISGNMGVPIIFDETSMNMMGNKAFTSMIYKLAQNKDKARLNKESILRDTERWATAIFFTGEASILENANANEGLHVRLFEFKNLQWTKSAKHSEELKDIMTNNYGHAGVKFVQYLLEKDPQEIKGIWQSFKEDLENQLPDSKFSSRVSAKFALVLTGARLANEALGINLSIDKITDLLIEQEEASMGVRELAPKFYNALREYIIQNKRSFKYRDEAVNPNQKIFGKVEIDGGKSYCYIFPTILKEISTELGFPDLKVLLSELKKSGYLKHEKERTLVKKQVFTKDEQDLRQKVLEDKAYRKSGDLTYCIVYEGNIFIDFFTSEKEKEKKSNQAVKERKIVETKNNSLASLFDD
jgi:putative DNA primase/helicase